ncbi:MAG: hypothetical protein KatS3mg105_2842 [Gemmatales bacterium]|nr:MAG: hypothetical protein KatS3mg105_2842 [Gemmatales bacterium]
MSTPATTRTSDPKPSAQQQLDELDALLQHMLSLPVHQLEDDPFSDLVPHPAGQGATPQESSDETPTNASQPDASLPDPEELQPTRTANDDERTSDTDNLKGPTAKDQPGSDASARQNEGRVPARPKTTLVPAQATQNTAPTPQALAMPLWLRALVAINSGFDRLALRCKIPVRWLRHPLGRSLIGWLGIAILLGSLTWAILDWLAWNW